MFQNQKNQLNITRLPRMSWLLSIWLAIVDGNTKALMRTTSWLLNTMVNAFGIDFYTRYSLTAIGKECLSLFNN